MMGEDGRSRPRWKPAGRWGAAATGLLDILLPPEDLGGGMARPQSAGLDAAAWTRIVFLDDPVCDGCGAPYAFPMAALCPACEAQPRAVSRTRAACLYDEHSRDLVLKLKHADRPEIGLLFGRWLHRAAAPLLLECDAVAPVPLHPSRLFLRRYNQAAEIARPLAAMAGRRYLADALVRRRATSTQGGKSGRGRRLNVKGAFDVPPSRRGRVEGRRILLVDDVLTTGSTAQACARALLAAGASAVDLAVVARVQEAQTLPI